MNLLRQLSRFGSIPFSHGALLPLLGTYKRPNDKISAWVADGTLLRLKKGLYVLGEEYRSAPVSLPLLANLLYGPSCVSLDFALAHHGLIPEGVYTVASVTTRRGKQFDTTLGRFIYYHVPASAYPIGIRLARNEDGSGFMIAGPEKALCDKIVLTRGLCRVSARNMQRFLSEELRIDPEDLRTLDTGILREYLANSGKTDVIATLIKVVEAMK